MTTVKTDPELPNPLDVRIDLRELQGEGLLAALPALLIAAILFMLIDQASGGRFFAFPASDVLIGLIVAVAIVHSRSYLASAWLLVAGSAVSVLLMATWGGMGEAITLLALPAGLASLFVSMPAGAGVAALCTIVLLSPPGPLQPLAFTLRILAIAQVWGTVGLVALTARPLLTAVEWSWSSHKRSLALLEHARDYQVQLKQTLEDLAAANAQLARLNDYAQAMRQAAEEARQAKEQFVANVSHELRTPLNMIIGFTELMTTSPETYAGTIPPALMAHLQIVLRNSRHLSSLVDDVLDLSQIEAGRMALTRERVDLTDVVETAKSAVSRLFASKGLYLDSEMPDGLPRVWCDKTRIREVLLNVLSNAARFTEQGGVNLRVLRDHQDVEMTVTDTGPGIAPEDLSRLFQPFEQLDGSIRRRHGGSGLGLAISRRFVELHGGRMWIESTPGQGSTVHVRLPFDPPEPAAEAPGRWINPEWEFKQRTRRSLASATHVRPRLVVLETGDTLQRILRRYTDNTDLVHVSSLGEASAELSRTPAQALLINDIAAMLPLRQLASKVMLPTGIPAIICSLPEPSDAAEALGASGYLIKPVAREQLQATLDHLHLKGKTVLVVDDEPEALTLFMNMLASMKRGYRVLTAANGQEALHILRKKKPGVILLDLIMPEMDGFQLLGECSRDPTLKNIPVIVMSARDPAGHPIVSAGLAVAQAGGMTAQQLLAGVNAMQAILSPGAQDGPILPESQDG